MLPCVCFFPFTSLLNLLAFTFTFLALDSLWAPEHWLWHSSQVSSHYLISLSSEFPSPPSQATVFLIPTLHDLDPHLTYTYLCSILISNPLRTYPLYFLVSIFLSSSKLFTWIWGKYSFSHIYNLFTLSPAIPATGPPLKAPQLRLSSCSPFPSNSKDSAFICLLSFSIFFVLSRPNVSNTDAYIASQFISIDALLLQTLKQCNSNLIWPWNYSYSKICSLSLLPPLPFRPNTTSRHTDFQWRYVSFCMVISTSVIFPANFTETYLG